MDCRQCCQNRLYHAQYWRMPDIQMNKENLPFRTSHISSPENQSYNTRRVLRCMWNYNRRATGNRQLAIGNRQGAIGKGQFATGKGQWAIANGQWATGD